MKYLALFVADLTSIKYAPLSVAIVAAVLATVTAIVFVKECTCSSAG